MFEKLKKNLQEIHTIRTIKHSGLFDKEYYLKNNLDVAQSCMNPIKHYVRHGWKEGRDPNQHFNTEWYLNTYPDVTDSGINPLYHYIEYGWKENRDPSIYFSTNIYLLSNPDIAQGQVNPLLHYMNHLCDEGSILLNNEKNDNILKELDQLYYQEDRDFSQYKSDIKILAFYLPQFHRIPENDKWWGEGFTDWVNTRKAGPRFHGHYQPREPHSDIGYYNLSDIEVMKKQAKLAKRHGIYGFCLYYYWFNGKRLLEKPVELILEHPEIDINFCLCWANENWTRSWDGKENDVLITQKYSPKDDIAFIEKLSKYFKDSRYIRINNKPVILVYRLSDIPEPDKTFKRWRNWCSDNGFGDIYIVCSLIGITDIYKDYDFDAIFDFPPNSPTIHPLRDISDNRDIIKYDYRVAASQASYQFRKSNFPWHVFPTIMLNWDNSPRREKGATIFTNFSLCYLRRWIKSAISYVRTILPSQERFVFVNAWNEWAEGSYLEPDKKYGYTLLNTVSEELFNLSNKNIFLDKRGREGRKTLRFISPSAIFKLLHFTQGENGEKKPMISVVIPIYDRTEILKLAIESILHQSFRDFELLLICDGSPLETLKIVEQYKSNPRVRIFKYNKNSGNAVRGRNRAIQQARGKYLAFLDSDDIAEKDRLKISYKYAEKYNADLVYGACKVKKSEDSINPIVSDGQIIFDKNCDYDYMLNGNPIIQSTVMAKTETLRKVGGLKTEMSYCEDYELWLRMVFLGCKFQPIPDVLVTLRIHNQNLEDKFRDKQKKWQQQALSEHKNIPKLKPSIAFVIPGQGISGGVMVICQHANMLIEKGYDVVLINNNNDSFSLDWFPDLLAPVIPVEKFQSNLDIIIATEWSTVYTAMEISAKRKLYFIQSDETRFNPPESAESRFARETYTCDFEFIVIAKWLKKWLKKEFNKDSYFVPNGLDTSLFYQDKPLVAKNEKIRVLLEGSIDIPFKGMKDAFEVVNGMDCEVWCVSYLGKPKPDWHCDKFFEKVPLKDMRRIYCSCDVLIKMTRVEGFFMPPLEMMACGGTVITNKVTGYDEYIKDNYNGLVVEQGDIEAAREKLKLLINDRNMLEKLKKGGIETAQNWTWEESNERFVKVLERI